MSDGAAAARVGVRTVAPMYIRDREPYEETMNTVLLPVMALENTFAGKRPDESKAA